MIFRCFDLETHLLSYYFLIEAFDMGSVHDKQMVFAKELWGVAAEGVSEFFWLSFDYLSFT